ncbi:hypothetical protein Tco_1443820 [Tanacetum coccineum]
MDSNQDTRTKLGQLDEDPNGAPVDPTRYQGMVESLMYLTASRPDLVFVVCVCVQYQAKLTEKHLTATLTMQVSKIQGKILWMWSRLTDYGFDYNKIPLYSNSKSDIALSCNIVQHSRTKHITIRYHFIKEQVENEVVELYFVKTDYQLVDIFTKALVRERYEFLINCLGMQSITPEELKYNNPVPKEKEIVRFSAVILNKKKRSLLGLEFKDFSGTKTEEGLCKKLQFRLVDNSKLDDVYLLNRN